LAAVTHVRVDRARLGVLVAGRFAQMLCLYRLSLCTGASLPRLRGAFRSFGLSTLGSRGLPVRCGAGALRLDRAASGALAKLARLLAATFVTPATRGAREEGDERQRYHGANCNCDDRSGVHGSS
jgi:hypothetical protein